VSLSPLQIFRGRHHSRELIPKKATKQTTKCPQNLRRISCLFFSAQCLTGGSTWWPRAFGKAREDHEEQQGGSSSFNEAHPGQLTTASQIRQSSALFLLTAELAP